MNELSGLAALGWPGAVVCVAIVLGVAYAAGEFFRSLR